jgi:hypothetical protein
MEAWYFERSLPTEIKLDSGAAPPIQPTISIQDVDKTDQETIKSPLSPSELDKQPVPGELRDAIAPTIPDWYRVGWRMVTDIDRPIPEGQEPDHNIVSLFVHDMYYGQWYHNAGVIFFVSGPVIPSQTPD